MEKLPLDQELAVFIVHLLKRLSYAFHRLDENANAEDGSTVKAFYFDSAYNYITALFLLDADKKSPGGTLTSVLTPLGYGSLLQPMRDLLNTPIGQTNVGEVIRLFRNRALVHTTHRDSDLNPIYALVDMEDSTMLATYLETLRQIREAAEALARNVAIAARIAPADLGLA